MKSNLAEFGADVGDKKFHALKTAWGIPKVLPLDSFTDASKGYLVNDCCSFGAEILIRNGHIKRSIVSPLETDCKRSYTWKIENFSDLNNDPLASPVFSFGEWSWKLKLYPRGDKRAKGKDLSLFLQLINVNELTHGRKLYTSYCLCIKNQIGKRLTPIRRADHEYSCNAWFHSESYALGKPSFISIGDLYDTQRGFLVDDTLVVELNIEVMLLLKDLDYNPVKRLKI